MTEEPRHWRIMWIRVRSYDDGETINVLMVLRRPNKSGSMKGKARKYNRVALNYWSKRDAFKDGSDYRYALLMNLPLKSILAKARQLASDYAGLHSIFEPIIPGKR